MKRALCLCCLCLLLTLWGCSGGNRLLPAPEDREPVRLEQSGPGASAGPEKAYAPLESLPERLDSFQLQVGDQLLTFPMTYEDLTALGWKPQADSSAVRAAGRSTISFCRTGENDVSLGFYATNTTEKELPGEQCQISGVNTTGQKVTAASGVFLPGGIQVGKATKEEAVKAYSQPDNSFFVEVDSTTHYRYLTENVYDTLELIFDSSGLLTGFSMDHPDMPEILYPSVEEYITDMGEYKAPAKLGTSLLDRAVEMDGDLYRLPMPVSELMKNGWETEDVPVAAGAVDFITMTRNGTEITLMIHNETEAEQRVKDTWVQNLSSNQVPEGSFAVSGGITREITEEGLKELAAAQGLTYTVTELEGKKRYSIPLSTRDWEDYCDVVFESGKETYIQLAYRGKTEQ